MKKLILFLLILFSKSAWAQDFEPQLKEMDTLYQLVRKHLNGNRDSMYYYLSQMENINKEVGDDNSWFNVQLIKAYDLNRIRDKHKLDSLYALMKRRFNKVPKDKQAFFYHSLGVYYFRNDLIDSSCYYFDKVVSVADTSWEDFYKLVDNSYKSLVRIYRTDAQYTRSLTYLDKYETFVDKYSEDNVAREVSLSEIHDSRGSLFLRIGSYEDATSEFKNALELAHTKLDSGELYYQLGKVRLRANDTLSARKYYTILEKDTTGAHPLSLAKLYASLFQLAIHENETMQVNRYFELCEEYSYKSTSNNQVRLMVGREAHLYYYREQYGKAAPLFRKVIEQFKNRPKKYRYDLRTAHSLYVDCLLHMDAPQSIISEAIKDHLIFLQDFNRFLIEDKLASQLIAHETEKKEIQNDQLIQQNKLKQSQLSSSRNLNIGVATILGLVLLLLWQQIKRRRELNAKNQQISLFARETAHRTKNQVALIANLITNQKQLVGTLPPDELINDIDGKVRALTEVNRTLEEDEQSAKVKLNNIMKSIVENNAYSLSQRSIDVDISTDPIKIDGGKASQLALVINELSTNSIKYAFDQVDQPQIKVELSVKDKEVHIRYSDNGKALKDHIVSHKSGQGTQLTEGIVDYMNGKLICDHTDNGYLAHIIIPHDAQ